MTFLSQLGLRYPLVVAPMAGGPTTPRLVGASCEAGALGSLGAAYLAPEQITTQMAEVRALTSKPFAVNLFMPHGDVLPPQKDVQAMLVRTQRYRDELKISTPTLQPPFEQPFEAQLDAVLFAKPAVVSFVFGKLDGARVRQIHKQGVLVLGAASTRDEAQQWDEAGADAITLQGVEAGGHRAIFDPGRDDPNIGTLALIEQCKHVIKAPLIAAGGLMNASHVAQALQAGAHAVQLGTAFLACSEAGTTEPYRRALAAARRHTKLTRAFSGRLARSVVNRFVQEMQDVDVLPFPAQNTFTRHLRNASAERGSTDFLSLWSGTGEGELHKGSACDLIASLFAHQDT